MEESASQIERAAREVDDSGRVAEAASRAEHRLRRQRATLRPLGWGVMLVVVISALSGHPAPGVHGTELAVTAALIAFVATLAYGVSDRFTAQAVGVQAGVIAVMGAAGATLGALQLHGATDLAGGAAVWMAVARLPTIAGVALGAAITLALDIALALAGSSSSGVAATTLLCALLGLIAHFMKQARHSQDQTELLMAQLEDAREEQLVAAAIAERGRIATELHDVLAHSLSGAAIQLQGARMLAERSHAEPRMSSAIERASELVKEGLSDARQAVGALRGDALPNIEQLEPLVSDFRRDMNLDATVRIVGAARALPAHASLALYRGAQEALTNVVRHAPGASTEVVLTYRAGATTLSVENQPPADRNPSPASWPQSAEAGASPVCASGSRVPAARCAPGPPAMGGE